MPKGDKPCRGCRQASGAAQGRSRPHSPSSVCRRRTKPREGASGAECPGKGGTARRDAAQHRPRQNRPCLQRGPFQREPSGDETCAGPARGSLTARRPTPRTCVSLVAQLRVHRCLETCGHALGGRGAGSFCTSRAPGANAGNRHPPCCTAACGCPICPLTLAHSLWDPVRPDRGAGRCCPPSESGGRGPGSPEGIAGKQLRAGFPKQRPQGGPLGRWQRRMAEATQVLPREGGQQVDQKAHLWVSVWGIHERFHLSALSRGVRGTKKSPGDTLMPWPALSCVCRTSQHLTSRCCPLAERREMVMTVPGLVTEPSTWHLPLRCSRPPPHAFLLGPRTLQLGAALQVLLSRAVSRAQTLSHRVGGARVSLGSA